jgi:hypothetical protein
VKNNFDGIYRVTPGWLQLFCTNSFPTHENGSRRRNTYLKRPFAERPPKRTLTYLQPTSVSSCLADIDGVFYVPIWMQVRRKSA